MVSVFLQVRSVGMIVTKHNAGNKSLRNAWTQNTTGQKNTSWQEYTPGKTAKEFVRKVLKSVETPVGTLPCFVGIKTQESVSHSRKGTKCVENVYLYRNNSLLVRWEGEKSVPVPVYSIWSDGQCAGGQCDQGGLCVDALQLNEKNERIRKTCNGKCIPWDQNCGGK